MGLNAYDANRTLVDQVQDLFIKHNIPYLDEWKNSIQGLENETIDRQQLIINRSLRSLVVTLAETHKIDSFEVRQYILDGALYPEWLRLLERGVFPWLISLTQPKNN
jgi:hypothetical protein